MNDSGGLKSPWEKILAYFQGLSRSTVIQHIAIFSGASFFAQGLMAINAIIIARFLAPEAYGLYIGTYSAVGLSSLFINWGLDTWVLRQGALSDDPRALAGRVLTIKGVVGVVWGTILFFLLPALGPNIYLKTLVLISTLDVGCDGFFNAELATLNAQKRVSTVSALLLTSRGGRLAGTIILVLIGARSPVFFAEARFAATVIALIIGTWTLRPKFGVMPIQPISTLRESMPYALSDLLSTIYLQADVTLLAIILGDRKGVGLYASAEGVVNAFFAIPAAAYQITLLALLRLEGKEVSVFRHAVIKMSTGFFALGVLLWLGLWVGGRSIIGFLLGPAYQQTGELLTILSPILIFKSLSFACASLLVAVGWQRYRVVAQVVSAAANILLNVLVIKQFGVQGVAVVYVVSEFILVIGYGGLALRWLRNIQLNRVVKWK